MVLPCYFAFLILMDHIILVFWSEVYSLQSFALNELKMIFYSSGPHFKGFQENTDNVSSTHSCIVFVRVYGRNKIQMHFTAVFVDK